MIMFTQIDIVMKIDYWIYTYDIKQTKNLFTDGFEWLVLERERFMNLFYHERSCIFL